MLEIKNLSVRTKTGDWLLQNISLNLMRGESLGLTGESGAGKTTLIKAIMGMSQREGNRISGTIVLDGVDIMHFSEAKRRELCGRVLGFIPQNPMTAFDPRLKVGKQMTETFQIRLGLTRKEALSLAESCLAAVNLREARRVLNAQPAELSGGMLQRVTVAIMMGLKPVYILADEPTAALDVDNCRLLLDLLNNQKKEAGILMISHDVKALRRFSSRVLVMEHGEITESGSMDQLICSPKREWTRQFAQLCKGTQGREWQWRELS